MPAPEPQITNIASYFATNLPSAEGDPADHSPAERQEAWRRTLRHARKTGAIGWLTELVEQEVPGDVTLKEHCEALRTPAE